MWPFTILDLNCSVDIYRRIQDCHRSIMKYPDPLLSRGFSERYIENDEVAGNLYSKVVFRPELGKGEGGSPMKFDWRRSVPRI